MEDYNITESATLPSLGKVYANKTVNPNVVLRTMTTEEEMKRLSSSERPYKILADIIDDCLVEKPGISAYDMCIGDFQYLLYRLRVVTYGPEYTLTSTCPYCRTQNSGSVNLDNMEVLSYTDEIDKYRVVKLPVTGKEIQLKLQTPRMLDDISIRAKEVQKKSTTNRDISLQLEIQSCIELVDGSKLDIVDLENFVRTLPLRDTNTIIQYASKLSNSIGVRTDLEVGCDLCGLDYNTSFRFNSEFFRPTINI